MKTSYVALDPKAEHHVVYFEEGRFGGWPANNGIWKWGNEILVGFSRGYHKDLGPEMHNIDREKPEESLFARSLDAGSTWKIEDPSSDGILVARGSSLHGTEPIYPNRQQPSDLTEAINFAHPDFAITFRFLNFNTGPSVFYYSYDRGHKWRGPFNLKVSGSSNILARTDALIISNSTCMAFLAASKADDSEGRPICAITRNGGLDWELLANIGPEPHGFGIMPSTIRLGEEEFYTTIRRREDTHRWIDAYRSMNSGETWTLEAPPVEDLGEGNPPSLIALNDGRLCLSYGVRAEPYRICAQLSDDKGKTWGPQIVIRDDGGGRDIGYVRSIQRDDSKIVTIYYFQDKLKQERYIASSIWQP